MHIFYTPDLITQTHTLSEEESKHCIRVLRLTIGNKICLIDGRGGLFKAEIILANAKKCEIKIVETILEYGKRNNNLHVAIAPTKSMERIEWFIEKATEIGIDEISLLNCKNSERSVVKTERLTKVAVAAIKQSVKAYLPKINNVKQFQIFIEELKNNKAQKFIAHCNDSIFHEGLQTGQSVHLKYLFEPNKNVIILIGPEGDFSNAEIKFALENEFKEINLGSSRLRTETAALYACAAFNILNER